MTPTLEAYEIIPLINAAWAESFGRILTTKTAIANEDGNHLLIT